MPTYIFKNKKTGIVYEDFMLTPRLIVVGKKHLPKYQKHIQIVNLLNNMVDEEPTKMLKLIKSERNTEIKLCEKHKELTNLNSVKDINISITTKTKTNGRL